MNAQVAKLFSLGPESPHLREALTHPSYANENPGIPDNQRLEFLGDSILGMFVAELLFELHPDADEGELTRLRARLVNSDALAAFARGFSLDDVVLLGRGAAGDGLRSRINVLADAVEALIAASFLDVGVDAARRACRVVAEFGLQQRVHDDPKSELQEHVQALGKPAPTYRVVATSGPSHRRQFEVMVAVGEDELCSATGPSKRAAERDAASRALDERLWETARADADRKRG